MESEINAVADANTFAGLTRANHGGGTEKLCLVLSRAVERHQLSLGRKAAAEPPRRRTAL